MVVIVVVDENDVMINLTNEDPNIGDQGKSHRHSNDDDLMMVMVDLKDILRDRQDRVSEME